MTHVTVSKVSPSRGRDHSYLSTAPPSDATTSAYQDDDGSASDSTEKAFASKVHASRIALCVGTALGLIITILELKVVNASRLGTASALFLSKYWLKPMVWVVNSFSILGSSLLIDHRC